MLHEGFGAGCQGQRHSGDEDCAKGRARTVSECILDNSVLTLGNPKGGGQDRRA